MHRSKASLLDKFVGARKQPNRDVQAERFGSLQIDYQLELRRLLDRKIARLFALENAINVPRCALVKIEILDAVGCQPAADRVITEGINVRQAVLSCQGNDKV